ncbi:MAG: CBS domain-containing protein [Phycisphaerae bacterium]
MGTVQKILEHKGREVVSIDDEAKVVDAARLMNERHIGALVVVRGETVVGIFTERDILNRVVAQLRDPAATTVHEVMTSPVACCSPETERAECRSVMRNRRIRHLPVVRDERLVGIISIGDILEDEGADQQETIRYLYEYLNVDWE